MLACCCPSLCGMDTTLPDLSCLLDWIPKIFRFFVGGTHAKRVHCAEWLEGWKCPLLRSALAIGIAFDCVTEGWAYRLCAVGSRTFS